MSTEEWRPVLGYEGMYEVSDLGRVRSLPRMDTYGNHLQRNAGRLMRLRPNVNGYPVVTLSNRRVRRYAKVHVLVCEAWHGPRPEGMEVRHLDGNPSNAVPGNLAWGTRSENAQDAVRHGTHSRSSRTCCKYGHEYTPENTSRDSSGHRECRACRKVWGARSYRNAQRRALEVVAA